MRPFVRTRKFLVGHGGKFPLICVYVALRGQEVWRVICGKMRSLQRQLCAEHFLGMHAPFGPLKQLAVASFRPEVNAVRSGLAQGFVRPLSIAMLMRVEQIVNMSNIKAT